MGLSQEELRKELLVARVSVNRWERDRGEPDAIAQKALVDWARKLPPFAGAPLRAALNDGPTPAITATEVKRALDEAVHRGAEGLDVKSRAFRMAVDGVLAVIASSGVNIDDARALLAAKG
jgi:hypothetical protein